MPQATNPRWGPLRRGFTVLEVLIAMVIFFAAFTSLSFIFVNNLETLGKLEIQADRQGTLRFIRSQILMIEDLDTLEDGGEIETLDLGTCRWEAEAEPTELAGLFALRLALEFEGTDTQEAFERSESLYVLRPTWMEQDEYSARISEAKDAYDNARRTR